jgi:hypothetical protein
MVLLAPIGECQWRDAIMGVVRRAFPDRYQFSGVVEWQWLEEDIINGRKWRRWRRSRWLTPSLRWPRMQALAAIFEPPNESRERNAQYVPTFPKEGAQSRRSRIRCTGDAGKGH